jgi:hypothetical protein
MATLTMIGQVLVIIAFLGFIGVCISIVVAAIALKKGAVNCAKRLTERPSRAVKNLTVTGKGIVQQETVRVKNIGKRVQTATGVVKETLDETREAASGINFEDLQPLLANLQQAAKLANMASQVFKSAAKQK